MDALTLSPESEVHALDARSAGDGRPAVGWRGATRSSKVLASRSVLDWGWERRGYGAQIISESELTGDFMTAVRHVWNEPVYHALYARPEDLIQDSFSTAFLDTLRVP